MHMLLGDTQLYTSVPLCYLLIRQDHVMDLVKGLLCGDSDLPYKTGVTFQALSAFKFSSPLLHHAARRGTLPLSLWISLGDKPFSLR